MEPRRPAEPAASTGTLNTRRLGRAQSTSVGLQGPPMPVQGHEATTAPSYRPSPEKCPPRRRQPLARSPPAWARLRSAVWEHRAVPRSPHGETGPATFAALLGAAAAAGTPRHAGVGALRGCARTSEALLPPSSSASPLTLLLEESQKRGEVPAHENHHGGQEEGLLPAGRGSAAAYRAGGGCRDRSSFSPRSSVPQDRLQDARREDARPAERLRGERPEPGGDARRQEGTARLLPARSRCWEEESRAPPLASRSPRPSPPSCTKRAGTHPAWHGAECREFPPNSCARGGIPPHHPHQSGLVPTGHSSPANRRAGLHSTVVNWEELGGISPPSINLRDLLQKGR